MLQNAPNSYQLQSADDHLITKIDRLCTNLFGFCSILLLVLKQKLLLDSNKESQLISKELKGAEHIGLTLQIPFNAEYSTWKVTGTIAKLRRWQVVTGDECLETVYLNEKPNYNTFFGQSEPNRAYRERRTGATLYRIRRESANCWQYIRSAGS